MADKRTIAVFMVLIIIFALIFFLAFISLQKNHALFGIGMPAQFEDWTIMILCIGSIGKIVWEIVKS